MLFEDEVAADALKGDAALDVLICKEAKEDDKVKSKSEDLDWYC
jgi:hypothetical protein